MKRYYAYLEEIIKSPVLIKVLIGLTILTLLLPLAILIGENLFSNGGIKLSLDLFLSSDFLYALLGSVLISLGIVLLVIKNLANDENIKKKIDNLYNSKKAYHRFINEINKLKLLEKLSDENFAKYIVFLKKINQITNSSNFQELPESLQNILISKLEDLEAYYIKLLTQKDLFSLNKFNPKSKVLTIKNKIYEIEEKIKNTNSKALKNSLIKHKKLLETRLQNVNEAHHNIELIEANLSHLETTLEHINDEIFLKSGILSQNLTERIENMINELDIHFTYLEDINFYNIETEINYDLEDYNPTNLKE